MKALRNLAVAAAGVAASAPAFAQTAGPDLTPLTSQIDGGTIVTGILAVGAVLIVPRLARMGVNWIKGSVR